MLAFTSAKFNKQHWSSGYDDCLTRSRSPVQSWDAVLFLLSFVDVGVRKLFVEGARTISRSVVGLVVRISAFQADGPGSIPGRRSFFCLPISRVDLSLVLLLRRRFKPQYTSFVGLVAMTPASHAGGRRFDPATKYVLKVW